MNYDKIIGHTISAGLLGMAGYYQSPAFAYAVVASLAVNAAVDVYAKLASTKEHKTGLPEEARRAIQDMNARIATLEYGVKQRGF